MAGIRRAVVLASEWGPFLSLDTFLVTVGRIHNQYSEQRASKLSRMLSRYDADDDGVISFEEFKQMALELRPAVPPAKVARLYSSYQTSLLSKGGTAMTLDQLEAPPSSAPTN